MTHIASIDFDEKNQEDVMNTYLSVMKYIMILTVPIYLEAIYCLVWKTPHFQKHYVMMLSIHVILCMLEEVYGFQLFRPLVFFPVVGIYADGLLSMMGVHVFIQIIGIFLLFQINSAVMIHITLFRLKVIIPVNYKYYDEVIKFGKIFTGLIYVLSVFTIVSFLLLYEDQLEAKLYIQKTLKPLPKVLWADNYVVSTTNNEGFSLFLEICASSILFYLCLCFVVPAISWYVLHKTKHTLSPKIVEAQKSYLITLLVQVSVMVGFVILPFAVFFGGMKYEITNPAIIATSMILAISNGAASTVTLLIGTRPHRQVIKQQLNHLCFTAGIAKAKRYVSSSNAVADVPSINAH